MQAWLRQVDTYDLIEKKKNNFDLMEKRKEITEKVEIHRRQGIT